LNQIACPSAEFYGVWIVEMVFVLDQDAFPVEE